MLNILNLNNKIIFKKIITAVILAVISSLIITNISYSQSISDILSKNLKQNKYPTVEEAFDLNAIIKPEGNVELTLTAIPDTYIYQNSFEFKTNNKQLKLLKPKYPKSKVIEDEHYGKTQVFFDKAVISIPYEAYEKTSFELTIDYQGCLKDVLCYPPASKLFLLNTAKTSSKLEGTQSTEEMPILTAEPEIKNDPSNYGVASIASATNNTNQDIQSVSEQSYAVNLLKNATVWSIILGFFAFGLLLSLTPCVLPMLPILSGIIAGHKHHMTKTHAFMLSFTYVFSMALTYMLAGILVAAAGVNLVSSLQQPAVIIVVCAIFIFLAIASFGFIELKLPDFITQKLSNTQKHQKGGTYIGVAIMGVLSALIISPCATAPLAGALLYISSTGNIFLGGIALFSMGFAMGMPILLFGTSAGHFIPRAGPWMKEINIFFGIVFLGLVIYLLSRLISGPMILVLWGFLLIFYAVHLGLLEPAKHGWQRVQKGFGLILAIYGAFLLAGATQNQSDIFHPFGIYNGNNTQYSNLNNSNINTSLDFKNIANIEELKTSLNTAKKYNRYTIVDFYADWCVSCRTIEQKIFPTPKVANILRDFNRLKIDVTKNTKQDQEIMKQLVVFNPPTLIFFGPDGKEIDNTRITSEIDADSLYKLLSNVQEN